MFSVASHSLRSLARVSSSRSQHIIQRDCYLWSCFVASNLSSLSSLPKDTIFAESSDHSAFGCRNYNVESAFLYQSPSISQHFTGIHTTNSCVSHNFTNRWLHAKHINTATVELKVDSDVVRFSVGKPFDNNVSPRKAKKIKKKKMSKKAKLNELRFYRLKAKKKMNSPNPEVRIRYKLEKAKRKEEWLIEKLRKFEGPAVLAETHDPEMLTEEEKHYLKRIGEKKKNYVPVGRRGVFGGVVLNMHLHWKKHETVKVTCKPCRPGQIHEYANELTRLSKGIVIDIKPNNTIIFYRGKNYVQPKVMSPPNTISKEKALEKYRYEQSLEHTSQFIEKLEKELEEYHNYLARHKKEKAGLISDSTV